MSPARDDPATTTWRLYQTLAAMWSAMAITNEDVAARTGDPARAELFRGRADRARDHAHRLQGRADGLRVRTPAECR